MRYVIQVRKENNLRRSDVDQIIESNGVDQKEWTNYKHSFATMDKASAECQSMIEAGHYKAHNVRVVRIEMVFKSKTIVEQHKP